LWFIPIIFACYFGVGLIDVLRNKPRLLSTFDRYFAGNGIFTWLLAPFNLLMDLLALPYWNRGIYKLNDLPQGYRDELEKVFAAAYSRDVVGQLEAKMTGQKRGMIFFKWYGKNIQTSLDIPEFHQSYKFVRTIGVSVFNKKQSTGKHFGPLRVTLRVLYNINTIESPNVYIQVGDHVHRWQDEKLFIFDDTLQHQSLRYCMFIDILRPSLFSGVMSSILWGLRLIISRFNFLFYQHWTFLK
jgi:beta-hydroxylase